MLILYSRVDQCLCYPWNMPKAKGLDVPLCTYMGNECFRQKFANSTHKLDYCSCLPSCSNFNYKIVIDSIKKFTTSEVEAMCKIRNPHQMYVYNTEAKPLIDIIKMMNVTEDAYDISIKSCIDYIANGYSRITVKIVGSSYLRRSQSIAMSFSDKLGVIGGTIGLFSGFSFVALFEFGYWVVITLIKYYKSSVEPEEVDPVQKLREEIEEMKEAMKEEIKELKKENNFMKEEIAKLKGTSLKKENIPPPEELSKTMVITEME